MALSFDSERGAPGSFVLPTHPVNPFKAMEKPSSRASLCAPCNRKAKGYALIERQEVASTHVPRP